MLETARSFCLCADGIGRSLRTGNDCIASFDQKVNKKKGRGFYRNQGIFHVPGLHPQLSPNFKVREFACKGSDVVLLDDELVVLLQCIREHFGKPVYITSGYRTAAHNAAVGGSKSSQHLLGRAADFHVEGVPVAAVAAYAETLLPSRGGIGRYPKDAAHPKRSTGWVHIDTRAGKSRWKM